jgi:redox-sensitive bicupin YhaK (pirin superfamily)
VEGASYFDLAPKCSCGEGDLILYEDGDQVMVTTEDAPVRFLLVSGRPIGEPVAWYGPIVMNTREELQAAFEEYQKGTFFKHR